MFTRCCVSFYRLFFLKRRENIRAEEEEEEKKHPMVALHNGIYKYIYFWVIFLFVCFVFLYYGCCFPASLDILVKCEIENKRSRLVREALVVLHSVTVCGASVCTCIYALQRTDVVFSVRYCILKLKSFFLEGETVTKHRNDAPCEGEEK